MLRARKLIVALALLSLALLAAVPAAGAKRRHRHPAQVSCAGADSPATTASKQDMRKAVVCLINAQRTERGLPSLSERPSLQRAAQHWTDVMVNTADFTHGSDFAARISAVGYVWSFAGENIATGFQTPREVVNAWMASPDHCRNILDPHYADVGTGLSPRRLGQFGPATWTQDFGLRMGQQSPSNDTGPQNGCPY